MPNTSMPNTRKHDVERVLDILRPAMAADGGAVELCDIVGDVVEVRLLGACTMCPSAELTIRRGIEPTLIRELPWIVGVTTASAKGTL